MLDVTTLLLSSLSIQWGQGQQVKEIERIINSRCPPVVQYVPVTVEVAPPRKAPDVEDQIDRLEELERLRERAAEIEELTRDCGHSNCTDFGSADILYS